MFPNNLLNFPTHPPTPLPLRAFCEASRSLEPTEFKQRFGTGFLLHHGGLRALPREGYAQRTVVTDIRLIDACFTGHAPLPFVVYLLRPADPSPLPGCVTIGRAPHNDVVLDDVSVSKLHAIVRCDNGRFALYDARSKNGTFVNGARVPAQGRGAAVLLDSGALIRTGAVELTFLASDHFRTLAQRAA